MTTRRQVPAFTPGQFDGFKEPETTRAIRNAFGMIDIQPRNRLNMVWHLVRHRGLFIDLHNTRNRKPVLRCTCGTLLADQAGTVK